MRIIKIPSCARSSCQSEILNVVSTRTAKVDSVPVSNGYTPVHPFSNQFLKRVRFLEHTLSEGKGDSILKLIYLIQLPARTTHSPR